MSSRIVLAAAVALSLFAHAATELDRAPTLDASFLQRIRFYSLDGFLDGDGDGLTQSYDSGSDAAVHQRWRPAVQAGVHVIATDHYERFDAARRVARAPKPRFKVLVIAELLDPKNPDGNEIHRPYVEAARRWLGKLAADSGFAVTYLESPNTITDSTLRTVNVIWQMNYPPFRWNAAAKAALEKYVASGRGGWLGVHHASLYGTAVTNETWPWFRDELLGGINYRNYISKFASGTVRVEDAAHPVFAGVPAAFPIATEEWYVWDRSPRARVHVLASVDERSYAFADSAQRGIRMGDHPVVWTNDALAGRNLYIFMGHHPNLFANAAYTRLLTNAIMWLATKPAVER
jgi:type 1 glutamine amidotransferase